jgi:hypothetical protein
MKNLVIIILAGFLLAGCTKQEYLGFNIIGNWKWVESSGGFSGKTETPKTTGNSILLEISKSSVKKYVNGVLVSDRTYTIEMKESIRGGQREMIVYGNGFWKQSIKLKIHRLVLSDEYNDGYQHEYIKEQRPLSNGL